MLPLTRALATTTLFLAAATFALAQGGGPTGGGGAGSGGGPGPGYALHVDLAYADRSAARNLLDVYVPDGVENPPVVVLIHGGGFMMGDKSAPDGLDMFLRAGLAVAAINYRLSDEAIWPAQLQDVTDAFAFVRANGDALGYDETRIASFGA